MCFIVVGADPCAPLYPCPVGTQVPQGADCKSYYQCVTPRDWVFLDNGCSGFGDFNPNLCMCDNLVPCESIDGICPDGVTSPPADPGIAPGKWGGHRKGSDTGVGRYGGGGAWGDMGVGGRSR